MFSVAVAFLIALAISVTSTPWVRRRAINWGAVDDPNRARKVHESATPRMGGLAIAAGFFGALFVLLAVETSVAQLFASNIRRITAVVGGGVLMLALGIYDDLVGANAPKKLVVQIAAALMMCALGFGISHIALPWGGNLNVGVVGIPITVLWVVGITNAVNLIDGLDGLAAGVSLFALVTMCAVGLVIGNFEGVLLTAALAGAVAGFLFHNFHPATIFMGDTGSLFIGFMVAATGLMTSTKSSTTVALLAPILALGLPVADTLLAMTRRVVRGRSPFSPDKDHIHHRLLELGSSHRKAVLKLWGFCLVACLVAMTMVVSNGPTTLLILILFASFAMLIGHRLGYFSRSYWVLLADSRRNDRQAQLERRQAIDGLLRQLRYVDTVEAVSELLGGVHGLHDYDMARLELFPGPARGARSAAPTPAACTLEWRRPVFEEGSADRQGEFEPNESPPLEVSFEFKSGHATHGRMSYRYDDGRQQLDVDDEALMERLHRALVRGVKRLQIDRLAPESVERDQTAHTGEMVQAGRV